MLDKLHDHLLQKPEDFWSANLFLGIPELRALAAQVPASRSLEAAVRDLGQAFNTSDLSMQAIERTAAQGDATASAIKQYLSDQGLCKFPYQPIPPALFQSLRPKLLENPELFLSNLTPGAVYPHYVKGRTYGYDLAWVWETLAESSRRFAEFCEGKGSETAVLVGNGPSLREVDFSRLRGQDVFISNYAIKNKELAALARGVGVTNHLVAEQEPYWFNLANCWKFFPLWLANSLVFDSSTIALNALGGNLFFSKDILKKIGWHSTVSFFWLQILYSAGYRKIVLVGFDNSYQQSSKAKEGDLIKQMEDDANHFDANYFKGKTWQAADTAKMSETYELAKQFYEADGREIVNSTVGGKLEVFRRSKLEDEISRPCCKTNHKKSSQKAIKVCVATAFWKGDCEQAELHWRLLSRLGAKSEMHLYLFKHGAKDLPFVSLPRVECLEIEKKYPELASLPHPAGPNLAFVETLRLLSKTDCTHFFWMEPDCIPTSPNWMDSFLKVLEKHPEEPIVGTGGGTVTPDKIFWKNHFCGCSLYNIQQLSRLDWDSYLQNELNVSFDIWLSVQLGFIRLGKVNNSDAQDTIIYGNDRHQWELVRKPEGLVIGMFEHWRPEKFLTPEALEERLTWKGFSLFHAVKCPEIIGRLYKRLPKSATTIVINYNNGPYLHKCLESAINQQCDGIRHEVVVVDDGSTDESREIIESFGDSVRALFLSHGMLVPNFNQQRAFKAGFEIASGEIICLLDGDDFFYPTKLAHLSRFFDDPRTVVAQHILDMVDESGHFMNNRRRSFPEHEQVTPELYSRTGRVNWFQPTSGLCFHRAYLETQIPKLQPDGHANVWLDVRLTRFAPYHGKVVSSTTPLGAWRRHEKSDSIRTDNVDERVRKHEEWYDVTSKSLRTSKIPFGWKKDRISFSAGESENESFESLGFETSQGTQKIGECKWKVKGGKVASTLALVFRSKKAVANRGIVSAISISSTKSLKAKLSLARHGKSPFEESSKEILLNPGQSEAFCILHEFKKNHEALKIQVTIPPGPDRELELEISNLSLFVLSNRTEKSQAGHLLFHNSNALMRNGSLEDSISIYYTLAKKNPELRMYMENADFALWKLGFKDEAIRKKIGEQLLQVVS